MTETEGIGEVRTHSEDPSRCDKDFCAIVSVCGLDYSCSCAWTHSDDDDNDDCEK